MSLSATAVTTTIRCRVGDPNDCCPCGSRLCLLVIAREVRVP
jgi:hypothetical protein